VQDLPGSLQRRAEATDLRPDLKFENQPAIRPIQLEQGFPCRRVEREHFERHRVTS
jgi:hypothetical protein